MNYTHRYPSVLDSLVPGKSWVGPIMDPTTVDCPVRPAHVALPFRTIGGRPVTPAPSMGIRYERNELGYWGKRLRTNALAAAEVVGSTGVKRRWIVMIERLDGCGWALPSGYIDPEEDPCDAARRKLWEVAQLVVEPSPERHLMLARYIPDPRAPDEVWMATVTSCVSLGTYDNHRQLPKVVGAVDARRARWVPAHTYTAVFKYLASNYDGDVFPADRALLAEVLG
ncbi:NUDIX domain-containing protein [Salinispora fenicalii]|uniref:NUDIX domain-containing protein n=1 Tax=Salinispora fenicalii TaxID=1137263 RepID=UPI0009EBD27F|nr:NUDIX domain-containing protein [Salinispora fenicalii]